MQKMISKEIDDLLFSLKNPADFSQDKYWDGIGHYIAQEECVKRICNQFTGNSDIHNVLAKVCIINTFYSTNIYAVARMAYHIVKKVNDVDRRLDFGDTHIVTDIAKVILGKDKDKESFCLSFASKYCSHHNPEAFPMYDKYVVEALTTLNEDSGFASFSKLGLRDYSQFCDVINKFIQLYDLIKYSLREVDYYLWWKGKAKIEKLMKL